MNISLKNILKNTAAAALTSGLLAGCVGGGSPFRSLSDILGVRINEEPRNFGSDYIFYPDYDVYYNRSSGEFVSFENGRWVARKSPRNTTTQRVFESRSINIDGFDSPAHHRSEMARQGVRYDQTRTNWQSQNRTPYYNRSGNTGRY